MAYADIRIEAPEALLGKEASADELYRVGLIYSEGMDLVAIDLVAAHKWFNLAATRGHRDAKLCRQEMADMMSSSEILKAQRAARDWMKKAN
jgi:TPR repeat protein